MTTVAPNKPAATNKSRAKRIFPSLNILIAVLTAVTAPSIPTIRPNVESAVRIAATPMLSGIAYLKKSNIFSPFKALKSLVLIS